MPATTATILAPQRLVKGTQESRVYAIDFSRLLATGETLSTITSVAATPTGTTADLVITGQVISGSQVQFRLSGGQTQIVYELEAIVVTSLGNTLEGAGRLVIGE